MAGFKPFGIASCKSEPVIIKLEEYESLKLINYEQLSQDLAAERMNISRPTFTRIYNRALSQIAKSLVEGTALLIKGGSFELEKEWYRCRKCFKLIEGIENHLKCKDCPCYSENELVRID